ncbi:MAG: hypothetical protein ACOCRX_10040 [Candidatus Woesearchaeota archaeon]
MAKMVEAPDLPEREEKFYITDRGLRDSR